MAAAKNLFPGINPHLNSYLQSEPGLWRSFHSIHITHLFEHIESHLPDGYFTLPEKSLQISREGSTRPSETVPDVLIYKTQESGTQTETMAAASDPVGVFPLIDTLVDEDFLTGLVIYQAGEGSTLGRPITRLELLSPANKPGGAHFTTYIVKRQETLQSGLRLVEMDYWHETRPIIKLLSSYPDQEPGAYPYTILVSDPRPTLEKGQTLHFSFGVDDTMPTIPVPLAGVDRFLLNTGEVYNRTFTASRLFQNQANYTHEPMHFERYTEADQARIRQRMNLIHHQP